MQDKILVKDELKVCEYEYACAIPGAQGVVSIYDQNGVFVPHTSKRKFGKKAYVSQDEKISEEVSSGCRYLDEEVVYMGFMRGHWGHFLVDSSVRLWALECPECAGKRILLNIEGMEAVYEKFFGYLGIDTRRIISLNEAVKFRSVLVPELSYFPGKYISKEYLAPFNRAVAQIHMDVPTYDKIYLSRIHFSKGKRELGEKDIQDVFVDNGYHVLYPEELSIEEQIWYYKNCKVMATTNGTIAHNIVFSGDETELIILNRFQQGENPHQKAINDLKNIKITYVNVYRERDAGNRNDSLMWKTPEFYEFCKQKEFCLRKEKVGRKLYLQLLFKLPFLYRWFK